MFIEIGFLILGIVLPVAAIVCYRLGVRDGRAVRDEQEFLPIANMASARTAKSAELTDEDKRSMTFLDNFFRYDGTSSGQKEIL